MKMLRNISKQYIALHGTSLTVFHTTDVWEQVLDNPGFYPKCTENGHRSSSSFPHLHFDAPCTQAYAFTPSDMSIQFPQPHSFSPLIPASSPASSPDQPPLLSFPVPTPYVPAPN
jgi:hypothetical protein